MLASNDWAVIERELMMTIGFIEASLGVEGGLTVAVSVEDQELNDRLLSWIASIPTLSSVETAPPSLVFEGTAVRDRVRPFRLDPLVNVLSGEVR